MGRQRKGRRFDPHFPISKATIQEESKYLGREVEDYEVIAPADVQTKLVERHANCENTWNHLCLMIEAMPERDQRIVQAMMFRDLWYVLELYKTYLQPICQEISPNSKPPIKAKTAPLAFTEFLFDLPAGKK
jgi:hypothetical protein